ncbi:hypothetical protein WHR41_08356 [Cladosporium halotolerans]|uniref:Rab-GAP TBC domain-containing protein n=1 Tax=Cladosporium halotolerans TaxID=1052096 RepID=A0AB34KGQ2_9PEZI
MGDHAAKPTGSLESHEQMTAGSPTTMRHDQLDSTSPSATESPPPRPFAGTPSSIAERKSNIRPKTAPHARGSAFAEHTSLLEGDLKRDSGFEPSTGTTAPHEIDSDTAPPARGLTQTPSLPKIVVQDAEGPHMHPLERIMSPFTRKRSHDGVRAKKSTEEPQRPHTAHQRLKSFHGIETDIPTGEMNEFSSDNIDFSKRGSLLFGGKKMRQLIAAQGDKPIEDMGDASSTQSSTVREEVEEGPSSIPLPLSPTSPTGPQDQDTGNVTPTSPTSPADPTSPVTPTSPIAPASPNAESEKRPGGLVSGRRKPSVQMLQAAIAGGRVLSAEEITFSMRVRSMYEHGDEKAADWTSTPFDGASRAASPELDRETPEPTSSIESVMVDKTRETPSRFGGRNPDEVRASYAKEAHEVAGGMEDWADLNGAEVDRFGFITPNRVTSHDSGLADIAEHQDSNKTADLSYRKEWSRNEKWLQMARKRSDSKGGGMSFDFDTSDPKLISRTWKGIPDRWRATAWHSFLSNSARRRGAQTSDEELVQHFHRLQDMNCADDVQIDVDVPRTISMHIMFRKRYRGGQRLLFRVLHAIALYCPDTGYVQGMASLAATLLCYFDEERAFVMLVRLWQLRGLEQLFRSGFDGLMAALQEFEDDWLRGGDVAARLEELGISSTAYGTRWYLTLFNMSVPFPAQLRVWDVFMLLGDAAGGASAGSFAGADLDVLHATSAALIDATREIILDTDFEGAMKTLTSFVPVRDEDMLMRVAKAEYKMKKKRSP